MFPSPAEIKVSTHIKIRSKKTTLSLFMIEVSMDKQSSYSFKTMNASHQHNLTSGFN